MKGNISQHGGKFSSLGGMFLFGRIEEPCHIQRTLLANLKVMSTLMPSPPPPHHRPNPLPMNPCILQNTISTKLVLWCLIYSECTINVASFQFLVYYLTHSLDTGSVNDILPELTFLRYYYYYNYQDIFYSKNKTEDNSLKSPKTTQMNK